MISGAEAVVDLALQARQFRGIFAWRTLVDETDSVRPGITAIVLNGAHVSFPVACVMPDVVALRIANIIVSLVIIAK